MLVISFSASMGVTADDAKTKTKFEPGFVSIFDGKTILQWEVTPETAAAAWTVKDGMIVGDGDKGIGYLVYENKEIADLELRLSYRFPGKGNSGIKFHSAPPENGHLYSILRSRNIDLVSEDLMVSQKHYVFKKRAFSENASKPLYMWSVFDAETITKQCIFVT